MLTPDKGLPEVARCQKRGHHEHTKHPPVFEVGWLSSFLINPESTKQQTTKLKSAKFQEMFV